MTVWIRKGSQRISPRTGGPGRFRTCCKLQDVYVDVKTDEPQLAT